MTTRRDLFVSLPALALLGEAFSIAGDAQPLQEPKPTAEQQAKSAAEAAKGTAIFAHNQIFHAATMPVHPGATGSSQPVNRGSLITGEGVEMHNTVLLPGHEPHPPHQHEHSEWLLIREGQVDWLLDGVRQPAGPGDICYAASNQLHGIRNVGTVPARYFVMAVGPNLKS